MKILRHRATVMRPDDLVTAANLTKTMFYVTRISCGRLTIPPLRDERRRVIASGLRRDLNETRDVRCLSGMNAG